MRAFTSVRLRTAAVAGLLLLGAAGVSVAEREGDASAHARAVQTFLATLDKAKTVQFEMTISSRTPGRTPTMPTVRRRYRVSVSRPDRLAVVPLTPETALFGMVSDGEELLCYTPYSHQYCLVDAPETLRGIHAAVFRTAVRDWELYQALSPFIEDPQILHERDPSDISDGEALGETEYGGVPCAVFLGSEAVAFFEEDKRGFYRGRQTFGQGWRQSKSGQWVARDILTVTIDKWTLDGDISGSEFSAKPPAGYQRVNNIEALPTEPDERERVTPTVLTADLPASASPGELRQRAWALLNEGYDNFPASNQLFQRAADKGDPLAGMWLAYLQHNGASGFAADREAADKRARTIAREVKRLAEAGNAEAQYLWGLACQYGLGMPADPKEAGRWTAQAAANGHVTAMYNVGTLLLTGAGGLRDETKGVALIEKAARKGDYFAIGEMGSFYHWGVGVEPNRGKALEWYMKATRLGQDYTGDIRMLTRCQRPHPFTADAIRAAPYVKLFGTRVEDLPKAAVVSGIVPATAVLVPPPPNASWLAYSYRKNGMAFVNRFGRIWVAELYAQGVKGFDQFPGQLPLGLAWDDTRESVIKKLGPPDEQGEDEGGYWMGYAIDDHTLGVLVSLEAPGHIQVVKVMARWAPQPRAKTPPAASVTGALKK